MRRILIIGNSGSGKSTLARQMSEILGIPAIYIDALRFLENKNWVETPKKEFQAKIAAAVSADEWIFEGCGTSTLPQRIERCDTIIFLDFNRFFCLYYAIKRRIQIRQKPRPELPKGCIDKIDKQFLKWIFWDYSKRSRPLILKMIYASDKPLHHLKKRKEVDQFISELQEVLTY
ncbi:MAG: AAA family ATPase [Defluviitaleaceae bacterium]|nr:AAA family ATPase [Defluviitaleaceae bacterium]